MPRSVSDLGPELAVARAQSQSAAGDFVVIPKPLVVNGTPHDLRSVAKDLTDLGL